MCNGKKVLDQCVDLIDGETRSILKKIQNFWEQQLHLLDKKSPKLQKGD